MYTWHKKEESIVAAMEAKGGEGGKGGCYSGLGYCVGTPLIVREEYEKKRGKRRGRISGDGE
jgi:hypothetical protein